MNSIKNIFITILVLTGTLATPKTYSKTIFLKSDFDSKKCHLNFQKNPDKFNSKFLNYTNKFFTNYTELNISKSGIPTRFSPKNNLGQKIELKQLASDLGYKRLAWVNYVTHDTDSMLDRDQNFVQAPCNDTPFGGYQNQGTKNYPFYGDVENCDHCQSQDHYQRPKITSKFPSVFEDHTSEPRLQPGDSISKVIIVPENKEIELIAKTIWGEGRGESYEGKVAIGNVIVNRYKVAQASRKSHWWGNTIEQIILHPYQFSCHNYNDPNKRKIAKLTTKDYHYRESLKIAKGILSGAIKDNTFGATHYFAYKTVQPRWALKMNKTKRIGNHDFYKK